MTKIEAKFQPERWLSEVIDGKTPIQFPDSEAEWSELLKTAVWHGVSALCHYQMTGAHIQHQCPDEFYDSLKKVTQQLAVTEMAISHELQQVLEELNHAGIEPLLMKGTPLAYTERSRTGPAMPS